MDIRSLLIIGILGFAAAGITNSIWFGLELKRFACRTSLLETDLDVFRFKKVVANQMYGALIQIVLLTLPPIIFVIGIMLDVLYGTDILFIIVPSAAILLIAGFFRSWELHTRAIPAATPELEEQRDAIVRTWRRKALPDW